MAQPHLPALIVFSGLPGTGKTTIARKLAHRLRAFYLRIDVIEHAIKGAGAQHIGAAGYCVANALAESNLLLGHAVVADCVNPVRESRLGWRRVTTRAPATLVDIHLICSDVAEHRRRVEARSSDMPGFAVPTWAEVMRQEFEPRDDDYLCLDTATLSIDELVTRSQVYTARRLETP